MRIRVKDVLDLLADATTEAESLDDNPDPEAEDFRACYTYTALYFNHPVFVTKSQAFPDERPLAAGPRAACPLRRNCPERAWRALTRLGVTMRLFATNFRTTARTVTPRIACYRSRREAGRVACR